MFTLIFIIPILLLLIASAKEELSPELCKKGLAKSFYKAGSYLSRKFFCNNGSYYVSRIGENLNLIDPSLKSHNKVHAYFTRKIALCLFVLSTGMLLCLCLDLSNRGSDQIIDSYILARKKDSYTVTLKPRLDSMEIPAIEYTVSSKELTKEEFEKSIASLEPKLIEAVLSNNQSADYVINKLQLVNELQDYPFTIEWDISKPDIINRNGELSDTIPEEGEIVTLTAIISYLDYKSEYTFSIMVFPLPLEDNERIANQLKEMISTNDNNSKTKDTLELPTQLRDISISWDEEKFPTYAVFSIIVIICTIFIFLGQDKDLSKELEKRRNQMIEDYPEIVSKLTLLIGAGLTIRNAWTKIAIDYKNQNTGKRYAYEEMCFAMYEMESGVSELNALNHFSSRTRIHRYIKLVALLKQSLKLGSKNLLDDLKLEVKDAFNEKKSLAERKGEEAGTKLLLPMFMMLLIVMVVIMIPAFTSM